MQTSEKDSVHAESEEKCTEWKKKSQKPQSRKNLWGHISDISFIQNEIAFGFLF